MRRVVPGREREDLLHVEIESVLGQRALGACEPLHLAVPPRDQRRVLLVDVQASPTGVLGGIAGGIGCVHHLRDALEGVVDRDQADARADAEGVGAPDELVLVHVLEEVVRDLDRVVRPAAVQQQPELVAPEARDHVVGADFQLQPLAELPQQLVACHVPGGVVDGLEPVEIDEAHGVRRPGRLRHLERALQPQLEFAAVDQASEGIVRGVVRKLLRQLVRRRDIGERALVEEDPSLGVADDARVLEHHDPWCRPCA